MTVDATDLMNDMLTDEDIRGHDQWGGQIPFGDLSDFAWDCTLTGAAKLLRSLAAVGEPVTPAELNALADRIENH